MGFGHSNERERKPGEVLFHPIHTHEYNAPNSLLNITRELGFHPQYKDFSCGQCGSESKGRVIGDMIRRTDGAMVLWCLCSCEGATIVVEKEGEVLMQLPAPSEFKIGNSWPDELGRLYEEAAKSFAAGAYTATAMVCRKMLMNCACEHGADENGTFTGYVDYITNIIGYAEAKSAIVRIKDIGGDATHRIEFVNQDNARRAMLIVTHLFNFLYSLRAA